MSKLNREEEIRIANYLKDYAEYLWNKQEKEYSAVIRQMIKGAVADINGLVDRLRAEEQ